MDELMRAKSWSADDDQPASEVSNELFDHGAESRSERGFRHIVQKNDIVGKELLRALDQRRKKQGIGLPDAWVGRGQVRAETT